MFAFPSLGYLHSESVLGAPDMHSRSCNPARSRQVGQWVSLRLTHLTYYYDRAASRAVGRNNRRALRRMSIQPVQLIRSGTSRPIRRINALGHQPVERRIGPVCHPGHMAMFDGVEMHVVHVCFEVALITDQVFPKAPLPDAAFSACSPHGGASFVDWQPLREVGLDQSPARREIRVSEGKFDDAMHVLRQDYPTMNGEGVPPANIPKYIAQQVDMAGEQVIAVPLQDIDREEIGAAWIPGATVVGHARIVPMDAIRRNALRLLRPTRPPAAAATRPANTAARRLPRRNRDGRPRPAHRPHRAPR